MSPATSRLGTGLDELMEKFGPSGYSQIVDRAHALRVLTDLALWGQTPRSGEIQDALARAESIRHPDSDTGTPKSYARLQEVRQFLSGDA